MIRFDKDIKDLNDRWMGLMEFIARHTLKENIIIGIFWLIFCISGSILFLIHPDLYDYVDNSLFVNMAIWLYSAMGIFFGGVTAFLLFLALIINFKEIFVLIGLILGAYLIFKENAKTLIPMLVAFICPLMVCFGYGDIEDMEKDWRGFKIENKKYKTRWGAFFEIIFGLIFMCVMVFLIVDITNPLSWWYSLIYIPIAIISCLIFFYLIKIPFIDDIYRYKQENEDRIKRRIEENKKRDEQIRQEWNKKETW